MYNVAPPRLIVSNNCFGLAFAIFVKSSKPLIFASFAFVITSPGSKPANHASLLSFTFAGFLPREKAARKKSAAEFKNRKETLIFLEAPYRLNQLLQDLSDGIGKERNAAVCINLTMPDERFERGTLGSLQKYFVEHPFKGEFVVIIEGSRGKFLPDAR